jgi:hypothetical protein
MYVYKSKMNGGFFFIIFRFGICCLFTLDECGTTVVANNTYVNYDKIPSKNNETLDFAHSLDRYVRNPGFPDEYEDLDDCSFNVRKISDGNNFIS